MNNGLRPAVEFCQVVTQTRNIGDTALSVAGDVANQWMSVAQCFAGRRARRPPLALVENPARKRDGLEWTVHLRRRAFLC